MRAAWWPVLIGWLLGSLRGVALATSLRVAVYPCEPLVMLRDGQPRGVFPEFLEAVARSEGWHIQYVPGTLAEGISRLAAGQVDLLMPAGRPAAGSPIRWVAPSGVLSSWGRIYASRSLEIQTASDLANRTIGILADDPAAHAFRTWLGQEGIRAAWVEFTDYDQVLRAVERRLLDAGLVDRHYGRRRASRFDVRPTYIVSPAVELGIAVAGPPAAWMKPLGEAIERFHADPNSAYHHAVRQWIQPYDGPALWSPRRGVVISVTLAVVAASAAGLVRLHRRWRQRPVELAARVRALEQRLAETEREVERSQKQAEQFRAWFAAGTDPAFVHGLNDGVSGVFLEVNDAACERLGYSREELLRLTPRDIRAGSEYDAPEATGQQLVTLQPPEVQARRKLEADRLFLRRLMREKKLREELLLLTRNRETIPVEMLCQLIEVNGQSYVFCSARDISARREVQQALQESEQRFRDFFSHSPMGLAMFDARGVLTDVNPAFLRMFGIAERKELAQHNLFEEPYMTEAGRAELQKGGTFHVETTVSVKEGEGAPVTRHIDLLISNLGLDRQFNPKGYMVQGQDVTTRRRAEEALQQSERYLRQVQKMEAIGTLAGGIAHDFNNLLSPILGYAEMALYSLEDRPEARAQVEEIIKAARCARDLVNQILAFSRQTKEELRPVQLTPIIRDVLRLLRPTLPPDVTARQELLTKRDIVRADPTQLHQVLMNLCANAVYAMKDRGGQLTVELADLIVDQHTTRPELLKLGPGEYVRLSVRDTGTGMDRQTMERIFEPFFTTKQPGEGTGMGLSVVHGIITRLRGVILVDSELGKGSVFHVVLPRVDLRERPTTETAAPLPRGYERILVVDDELEILHLLEQMLQSLGYRTVSCRSAEAALRRIEETPNIADLVLTDQNMPGMTGVTLARKIHAIRPDLPVILCTGFSLTAGEDEMQAADIRAVLMKPVVLRTMAEQVRQVLDGASQGLREAPR